LKSQWGPTWLLSAADGVAKGRETLALVAGAQEVAIAHHSARTLRYALAIAELENERDVEPDLLFHACLLHDIGASSLPTGTQRFEVEGADIAADTVVGHGYTQAQTEKVWQAVALHTSPHIAERMGSLTRLVRLGVRADFGDNLIDAELRRQTEADLPRLDVERVLSRVVVEACLVDPRRAPAASWPNALLAAHQTSSHPDARLTAF